MVCTESTALRPVVYVGDDEAQSATLSAAFESRGYAFEHVYSDDARPENLTEPWYRVVVLDLDPSSSEGLSLLQQVRARHAGVPVIVVAQTGSMQLTKLALAQLHGAEALFFKPASRPDELVDAVELAFRRLDHWRDVISGLKS